jgi:hypothetical protein
LHDDLREVQLTGDFVTAQAPANQVVDKAEDAQLFPVAAHRVPSFLPCKRDRTFPLGAQLRASAVLLACYQARVKVSE